MVVISQNLNIDIKGETNKRNVLRLIQKHIAGIEGQEHLRDKLSYISLLKQTEEGRDKANRRRAG